MIRACTDRQSRNCNSQMRKRVWRAFQERTVLIINFCMNRAAHFMACHDTCWAMKDSTFCGRDRVDKDL
jgi:hypothetical protein